MQAVRAQYKRLSEILQNKRMEKGNDRQELSMLDEQTTESELGDNKHDVDVVDAILFDLGGTFKKYQIINYILFCIPFALSGTFALSYVFTALNLSYR